jgi:predicted Holliday junction resolvase-like endonuclease
MPAWVTALIAVLKPIVTKIITELGKYFIYKKIGKEEAERKRLEDSVRHKEAEVKLREEYERIDTNSRRDGSTKSGLIKRVQREKSDSSDTSDRVPPDS